MLVVVKLFLQAGYVASAMASEADLNESGKVEDRGLAGADEIEKFLLLQYAEIQIEILV